MNFRTIEDLNRTILANLPRIPADVDLIVGVPRSGLLAANLLALYLNRPLTDVEGLLQRRLLQSGRRGLRADDNAANPRRILIVDDSLGKGTQMRAVRERLQDANLAGRVEYLAVYVSPGREHEVDYALETLDTPRYFQWNVMHHSHLVRCCVDIDGVLCVDPTEDQNDDGECYRNFLASAAPLFLPTPEIGWLVTCRLEKYRAETESWLARHGVRYQNLVMMNAATKEERKRLGHGSFKAKVYRDSGAILFLESSRRQAVTIAQQSGLPVLCVSTMEMIAPSLIARVPTQLSRLPGRVYRKLSRIGQRVRKITAC